MNIILLIGLCIFALSSAYFYATQQDEETFRAAFFVSAITLISYLLMYSGEWSVARFGEPILYTRWFGYALSCSLLMYSIGKYLGRSGVEIANMMGLTVLVMVTGGYAAIFAGLPLSWLMFAVSTVLYVLLVKPLLIGVEADKKIRTFILLGWNMFPVVFLFSGAVFGVLSAAVTAGLYLILDVFTKIVFYLVLKNR